MTTLIDQYPTRTTAPPHVVTHRGDRHSVNVARTERWISALGGGALALYGLRRRDVPGAGLAALAAPLIFRGLSGRCPAYDALALSTAGGRLHAVTADREQATGGEAKQVTRSVTVAKPRSDVESLWRTQHPSLPAGASVMFAEAPGGRGTEVRVSFSMPDSRAATMGRAIAKLAGDAPDLEVQRTLRTFKQRCEIGEPPTVEGQPVGEEQRGRERHPGRQSQPAGRRAA